MGGAAPFIMAGSQILQALGNRKGPQTGVATPPDLAGPRQNQINFVDYLLGGNNPAGSPGSSDPLTRAQNLFGNFSVPQTDLQRLGAGNISNMLNANAPGSAQNVLQGMMTGTGPQFERDIASANQQGGRFSSSNDILRGEALRNLYNMRLQTAGTMGALNQLGFGTGQAQAQQADIQTQRLLQLLGGGLGLRQQQTMELPITQRPNTAQALGGAGGNIADWLGLFGGGGRRGVTSGTNNPPTVNGSPGGFLNK